MSYIVSYKTKTITPSGGMERFRRVAEFDHPPNTATLDRLGLNKLDQDYTVRAIACLAAEKIKVSDGEFLVRYTSGTTEWTALIKVSLRVAPLTSEVI